MGGLGNSRKVQVRISDAQSLAEAGDWLHDAFFNPQDVAYRPADGVFELVAWREASELPSRPKGCLWVIPGIEYRLVPCVWQMRFVEGLVLDDREWGRLEWGWLDEVHYSPETRGVRIESLPPMRLELTVTRLLGELADIGSPVWDDEIDWRTGRPRVRMEPE